MQFLIIVSLFYAGSLHAHGGVDHSKHLKIIQKTEGPSDRLGEVYKSINLDYKAHVEPIFKSKCFDCHSNHTNYPWYYKIFGISHLIKSHIKEGRGHLDMSQGFPFNSHAKPLEDLAGIEKSVGQDTMPPWYYRPFHTGSELSEKEKNEIGIWIKNSREKLK